KRLSSVATNAWRTGRGISVKGSTVRRSRPSSLIKRPSAAKTFDVCIWTLSPVPIRREMLGQCSPAQTRVHEPYASPNRYAATRTAAAIRRARVLGCCHQVTGLGRETGAGIEAIALQPSEGHRRLPAVGASRTIPRHVGPLCGARVAWLPAPRHATDPAPSRRAAPDRVLRLRPHRAQLPGREPDAAHAAATLPAVRPQTDRADGRRHWSDRRSQ